MVEFVAPRPAGALAKVDATDFACNAGNLEVWQCLEASDNPLPANSMPQSGWFLAVFGGMIQRIL
jgi:hypothetical protein